MCTLLSLEAGSAHGEVFWRNERARYEHGLYVPLEAQFHPHEMAVLTGLPPRPSSSTVCLCFTSSGSESASKSHIDLSAPGIFWNPDAHSHVAILQGLQTCAPPNRTLISPESALSRLPWLLTLANSPVQLHVLHDSFPTICPHPHHTALVPAPIVSFLYDSFITALLKFGLLPFKLYTATKKDWKHKSAHPTICCEVCNDNPLLRVNGFH